MTHDGNPFEKSQGASRRESFSPHDITRIGVILGPLGDLNQLALNYLILHLNTLQDSFEFEILPNCLNDYFVRSNQFMKNLASKTPVNRHEIKSQVPDFIEEYNAYLTNSNTKFSLHESPPVHFILVSTATFHDNYILTSKDNLSIVALGNWKRHMAPPSIIEFILILILRSSVSKVCPSLTISAHLGTKGCLFDFTASIDEARYKVLNGFICHYCSGIMEKQGLKKMRDNLLRILSKDWLGTSSDPHSPAALTAKLGYDLFVTKGLKATTWEIFLSNLQQEGTKELIKIAGGIILVGILIWLGLKVA